MEAASLGHLALALAAGGLTTLSPCVFPLLPLVVGGSLQGHRAGPLAMGLGMTLSFALIGLVVGLAGPALGIDGDSVRTAGGWLLLILGVVMLVPALSERFTNLMTPLASGADQLSGKLNAGSLGGALLLGALLVTATSCWYVSPAFGGRTRLVTLATCTDQPFVRVGEVVGCVGWAEAADGSAAWGYGERRDGALVWVRP